MNKCLCKSTVNVDNGQMVMVKELTHGGHLYFDNSGNKCNLGVLSINFCPICGRKLGYNGET